MDRIPSSSGIYFVRPTRDDFISVNADRPNISERCIKVNQHNCKYGRSKNLAKRFQGYQRPFGIDGMTFTVLLVTEAYVQIEKQLNIHFHQFRMRGSTGRLNEWLEGIDPSEAFSSASEICRKWADVSSTAAIGTSPITTEISDRSPGYRIADAFDQSKIFLPSDIVDATNYLEARGINLRLFQRMHHMGTNQNFSSVRRHFLKTSAIGSQTNWKLAARLCYVAENHRSKGGPFEALVAEAIRSFPK